MRILLVCPACLSRIGLGRPCAITRAAHSLRSCRVRCSHRHAVKGAPTVMRLAALWAPIVLFSASETSAEIKVEKPVSLTSGYYIQHSKIKELHLKMQ